MKRLALICVALAALTFASNEYPPKPLPPKLTDIPGDGGTNVYVTWRHFETVPGIRYDLLRSEDGVNFEVITPLQVKTITYEKQDKPENDVSSWNYYLLLRDCGQDLPCVEVVKATPGNVDSLAALGAEKILRVELGVPPPEELGKLPNKFALGEFYRVVPDMSIAQRPQPQTVPKRLFDVLGISVSSLGDVTVELTPPPEELEFVRKGKRIVAAGEDDMGLILKYGKRIISFVTDKARYTVKHDEFQYLDRNNIKPGKHYVYKVRLYQVDIPIKKVFADSDTSGITPQDEPPVAPNKITALYDSTSSIAVLHIGYGGGLAGMASLFDNKSYTIYKTTLSDTGRSQGTEVIKVDASWRAVRLEGVGPESAFYIVVEDAGGKTDTTDLIVPVPTKLGSVPLPPDLRVADHKNDQGKKIDVLWGPPTLAVGYSVEDMSPVKKVEDLSDRNVFWVPTAEGGTLVVAPDTTNLPQGARKVLRLSYIVPGGKKLLKVRYQMWTNSADKALYGEFKLDGQKKVDKDNTGEVQFKNVEEGKYTLEGRIITKSGGALKNPEANVSMDVDATGTHKVPIETPPYVYYIYRGTDPKDLTTFKLVGAVGADSREFVDTFKDFRDAHGIFYYIVQVVGPDGAVAQSDPLGPITPVGNAFHSEKLVIFLGLVIFVGVALYFIYHAKRGRQFYIRPIAGLVHIEEALGRATEMGKPIVYVPGLGWIDDIATISALTILGRVARKAAEYQTKIYVPCYDPIVMIVAQETVRNAFMDAGRPDLYNEENIYYIAAQQFAYAAAVSGLMIREKSAANFFMGRFYAESLILAETGASTGAIQVAGTDDMTQLPFFITACDYTLIGEELYAASAYLSADPMQKGSLKAQDFLKAIEMIILVVGVVAASAGMWWFTNIFKALVGE